MTRDQLTRDQLLTTLRAIKARQAHDAEPVCDEEQDHHDADRALLEFIADAEVEQTFTSIRRWYS